MGSFMSKNLVTVTLVWDYCSLDKAIVTKVKDVFSDLGYKNIRHDTSDRYKNRLSGQIRLKSYDPYHTVCLDTIPSYYGASGVNVQIVDPETDDY